MDTASKALPFFGEAEGLLLDEAKGRFEFEMKSAATLHSKSTLFLALAGFFAAFLTAQLYERAPVD